MNNVLNSVIKFDLHIHSKASDYKEAKGIVDQSTKENLGILLSKLNEHNVALFSITDHNRFDPEIYKGINKILTQDNNQYPNVKAVLAGVEFDVIIENGMDKCHIIAIFDANHNTEKLEKIKAGLDKNPLTDSDGAYNKKEFENILEEIGLDTILIASQRKGINNRNGKHNSLSDSATDVEQIIRVGYINALEFQKPKVEGILLSNLKELSLPITLFSGSDCHDWRCYPYHDNKNQNTAFHHSKANILPTFKGLLMAVTSPETRFNRNENINTSIIESIEINGYQVPLVNGVNSIVGENGSGKTTLLKLLNGNVKEKYVKKLVNDNGLTVKNSVDPEKVKYIAQGQLIDGFNNGTLFSAGEATNFEEVDCAPFIDAYTKYSDTLKKGIRSLIDKQNAIDALDTHSITYAEGMVSDNYFVNIKGYEAFENIDNPHEVPYKEISSLLQAVNNLLASDYYKQFNDQLMRITSELTSIRDAINGKRIAVANEANIKNIIRGSINDYSRKIEKNSTSLQRENIAHEQKKQQLKDSLLNALRLSLKDVVWPVAPPKFEGVSKKQKQGFYFNCEANFNGVSMLEIFYTTMFVNDYRDITKLQAINSFDLFKDAIKTCTAVSDIDTKWTDNFKKFISEAEKTNKYILNSSQKQIGNTLGEMSLSYYDYFTHDDSNWGILIIDQPEDNISNNNISQKLIGYLESIRDKKQIIFVTHNPLLVVNLDVDNVIFVKNANGKLSIDSGCLEYEDEQTDILDLIAKNMDGGKETIEKRLKVYGKSH